MNEIIFRYLNSFAGKYSWLDTLVVFSAETLAVVLLLGLVYFLFSHEHKGKGFHNVIVVLSTALLALLVALFIKYIYPYPRPFDVLDNVTKLINPNSMNSFPSGHATFFSAIAGVLYFYHKKLAIFYTLGALLIGVSRVVAGIHWPFDILTGYIVGGLVAVFVYNLYVSVFIKK